MTSFNELGGDTRDDFLFLLVPERSKLWHRHDRIFLSVDWFLVAQTLFPTFFIDVFDIVFLDVPGIAQHDVRKVNTGIGGINRSAEALFDQVGNVAAVVDVGMAEDHRVNLRRFEWEIQINPIRLFAFSLVGTAIQQEFVSVMLDQVH